MSVQTNAQTRLWSIWPDGHKLYHYAVVVWRMMWSGGKERVILKARHQYADLLFDFVDGMTLEIVGGSVGDPSDYDDPNMYTLYRLTNCKAGRKWIPQLIAMGSNEVSALNVYLEVNCEIERFRDDRS